MSHAIIIICANADHKNKLGGYGVHIYEYDDIAYYTVKPTSAISAKLIDGVYLSSDGVSKSWPIGDKHKDALKTAVISNSHEISGAVNDASLSKSESAGFLHALEYILDKGYESATIYCDSRYVAEHLEKLYKNKDTMVLKRKDGSNISTYNLWSEITRIVLIFMSNNTRITLRWAQNNVPKEKIEYCKLLAKKGLALAFNNHKTLIQSYPKGKKKPSESRCHGFLTQSRLYFIPAISNKTSSGKRFYYCGEHESRSKSNKGDLLRWCGKPRSESTISAFILNEPDPVIDSIIDRVVQSQIGFRNGRIIKLDAIKTAETRDTIIEHGDKLLINDSDTNGINYYTRSAICVEQNPPYLFFSFYEKLDSLYRRLNRYACDETDEATICYTITDLVYSIDKKGTYQISKALFTKKCINVAIKEYSVDITLTMGIDLLNDLGLKRIAKENPIVKLFIEKTGPNTIRYFVYIKTDKAMGLFTTTHSNIIFLVKG